MCVFCLYLLQSMEPYLNGAMKITLGDRYSAQIEEIYTKTAHFIVTTMHDAC